MARYPFLLGVLLATLAAALLPTPQSWSLVAGDEPKKPVTVSRDQIYQTCDTYAPKYLSFADGDPADRVYNKFTACIDSGASNVFLVRGDDVVAAMKAGQQIFGEGASAREAVQPSWDVKSSQVWLGAYLGTSGSAPPRWKVSSIEIDQKRLRLSYTVNDSRIFSQDIHRYLALGPVGKLPPGQYTLELFDAGEGEVTFSRRVRVR